MSKKKQKFSILNKKYFLVLFLVFLIIFMLFFENIRKDRILDKCIEDKKKLNSQLKTYLLNNNSEAKYDTIKKNIDNITVENLTNKQILNRLEECSSKHLEEVRNEIKVIKKKYLIDSNNQKDLQEKYAFLYSDNITEYGFQEPIIGDFILLFDNCVLVYNYEDDDVKSVFKITNLSMN